jgi:hypothetical protein
MQDLLDASVYPLLGGAAPLLVAVQVGEYRRWRATRYVGRHRRAVAYVGRHRRG